MPIDFSAAAAMLCLLALVGALATYIVRACTVEAAAVDEAAKSRNLSPAEGADDTHKFAVSLDCECGAKLILSSGLQGQTVICPQCSASRQIPKVA